MKNIWRKFTSVLKNGLSMCSLSENASHLSTVAKDQISNDYIYQKSLANGGFAQVRLYKCRTNGKLVVIKSLHRSNSSFDGFTEEEVSKHLETMLEEEYEHGRMLSHPYIVNTLGIDPKSRSIILEYCRGSDFLETLDFNRPNWKILIRCFNQLLSAVEYVHDAGLAHLDIKLENIIYDASCGIIKLIDFGQSKRVDNETEGKLFGQRGTIEYMAPEIVTEKKYYYGKPADMWSCGIVLYNFIYNNMPWRIASTSDRRFQAFCVYLKKNQLQPQIFDTQVLKMSEATVLNLMGLFYGLLQVDPQKRFTVTEGRDALNKLLFTSEDINPGPEFSM